MSEIASVDQLQRFLFNQANVRGELVQLKSTYQHILIPMLTLLSFKRY